VIINNFISQTFKTHIVSAEPSEDPEGFGINKWNYMLLESLDISLLDDFIELARSDTQFNLPEDASSIQSVVGYGGKFVTEGASGTELYIHLAYYTNDGEFYSVVVRIENSSDLYLNLVMTDKYGDINYQETDFGGGVSNNGCPATTQAGMTTIASGNATNLCVPNRGDADFKGWYYDAAFSQPVVNIFTDTYPSQAAGGCSYRLYIPKRGGCVNLYSKWEAQGDASEPPPEQHFDLQISTDRYEYDTNEAVLVSGEGWANGEDVDVKIHSTERFAGTLKADADGKFSAYFVFPEIEEGLHEITATGETEDRVASTTILMTTPASLGETGLAASILLLIVSLLLLGTCVRISKT
jgi:hypothetical protein